MSEAVKIIELDSDSDEFHLEFVNTKILGISGEIVHLAESHGAYDDPRTWCGLEFARNSEDLDDVTCAKCLDVVIVFGKDAERRAAELAGPTDRVHVLDDTPCDVPTCQMSHKRKGAPF